MPEKRTAFAHELKRLREAAGYTQAGLAEAAGVSGGYVRQLETDKKPPTQRVIRKLSGPLGVSSNRLFSTIGMVEMDLAGTLAAGRDKVSGAMPDLSPEQLEELADYLTFLHFKASVLE